MRGTCSSSTANRCSRVVWFAQFPVDRLTVKEKWNRLPVLVRIRSMNKPPTYSVEALQDVVIRAAVKAEHAGGHREEWIILRAGERRKGLAFVVGIHPAIVPEIRPLLFNGVRVALAADWPDPNLPTDVFAR